MNNKCIICDEEFSDETSLKKHVDEHLNSSILHSPVEKFVSDNFFTDSKIVKLDIKNIFPAKKFEKLVESKLNSITNVQEIIKKIKFVNQIKWISQKNPFCYPSFFIEDYVSGIAKTQLQEKYHFWFWKDLSSTVAMLRLSNDERYSSFYYENAKELNLKIDDWKKQYTEFQENHKFFKNEIDSLFFDNLLQAEILFILMDNELDTDEISKTCVEIQNHYDLFHFLNDDSDRSQKLIESFNILLQNNFEDRIENILTGLKESNIISRSKKDASKYQIDFSIDKIKTAIIRELKISQAIRYSELRNKISSQFPALRLIPKFGVFESAWRELVKEEKISLQNISMKTSDFMVFLNQTYTQISIDVNNIENEQKKIPFLGRKINPDKFIEELLELDKGDFDDKDDQVTRLAGLVLAESVKLQSPREEIEDFDFIVDMRNYEFRKEQLDAIAKINFRPLNGRDFGILHVKVMINEELSFSKYLELKNKIPANEQGAIITFEKISSEIMNDMKNDPSIQIIDEEGVRIWVSITPQIPARVNSISKIIFDPLSKLENKIVHVNSIIYDKGIAIVTVFPEMNEKTVLVRTLEEVELTSSSPLNFHFISQNYFNFLKLLSKLSTSDEFNKGFFLNVLDNSSENYFENYSKIEIKMEDNYKPSISNKSYEISTRNCNCVCDSFFDVTKLCRHLIFLFDYFAKNSDHLNFNFKSQNILYERLMDFVTHTVYDQISAISDYSGKDVSKIFKTYIKKCFDVEFFSDAQIKNETKTIENRSKAIVSKGKGYDAWKREQKNKSRIFNSKYISKHDEIIKINFEQSKEIEKNILEIFDDDIDCKKSFLIVKTYLKILPLSRIKFIYDCL